VFIIHVSKEPIFKQAAETENLGVKLGELMPNKEHPWIKSAIGTREGCFSEKDGESVKE
jgi:hypothetical protein